MSPLASDRVRPRRPGSDAGRSRGWPVGRAWLLFAGTVLLQLVVLYAPRAPGVGTGVGLDKVVHVAVFGAVAVAAARVGLRRGVTAGALAVHAVLSEVLQASVLPQRSGDPWDVVADCVGVVLGGLIARVVSPAGGR
ncbi:MAG: VanZ family protein [Angustibacter sp.]